MHTEASAMLAREGIKVTLIQNEQSPHKTELNPYEPLSPAAAEFEQRECNAIGRDFIAAVARGRGFSFGTVERDFGKGRVLTAADALAVKMIDAIGGFDDALRLAVSPSAMRAERLAEARARAVTALPDDVAARAEQLAGAKERAAESERRRRRLDLLRLA
jgi:ClpP class serine protease